MTDRDLVLHVLAKETDPHRVTVADICTSDPVVAYPDEPLDGALERMAAEQVRRLPVVADGRLVGMLAQADVARTAHAEDNRQARRGDLAGLSGSPRPRFRHECAGYRLVPAVTHPAGTQRKE